MNDNPAPLLPTDPGDNLELAVRELVASNLLLNKQIGEVKARLTRRTVVFVLAIILGSGILGWAVTAAYQVSLDNRTAIDVNNQKFCPVVSILVPKPGDPAPRDERAVRIRADAVKVYADIGCPPISTAPAVLTPTTRSTK